MAHKWNGRPRHYDSPEEFDAAVDQYVEDTRAEGRPLTWTGLALGLGFASRSAIDEYAKYDGFSYSVKRAKAIIESAYEESLAKGEKAAAGPIFALKNFGWKDKQEVDHQSSDGSMSPPAPMYKVVDE